MEIVGINTVIPILSFIKGGQATDKISQAIEKFFLFFHITYTVKYLLIFIILLFLVKAAFLFFTQYVIAEITADYEKTMRGALLKLTFAADWRYLSKQKIGHLDQILTTNIVNSSALLFYIGGIMIMIANIVVYGILAFNISPIIALLVFVLGGVIFIIFKPLFYRNRVAYREITQKYKHIAHYVNEHMIGMKTVKAMFVGESVLTVGLTYFERMKDLYIRVSMLKNCTNVILQPVGLIFIIGIFSFFYKTTMLNLASFAVIIYAINKVFANIQLAQSQAHAISSQIPHLMSVLNYKDETIQCAEKDGGQKTFSFQKSLKLQNVHFAYDDERKEYVLSGLSFDIKKGSIIGLVGQSGAGKTTIVDLLLRLFYPQKGVILLDGENIDNIKLSSWRANIGYVSQDIFLLNDTIENNIKFYNEALEHEDIVLAARMANIHEFIEKQPNGYKTIVGERGTMLSGGQRQRIVLARALVRRPQILILDEATSALDNESEMMIQKSIESLKGKMTVIAIAHRLSTVMISDKLIVLENGKIIEEGMPDELLKDKDSHFFKMYNVRK
ncbi:MAG: ABC transporter ATP-binding protein [Candidatus Niyogibacteria bacterium]|nr:ABC transporter ATP-binding protein [Candidatus Niyogibacteria bacterium]